MLTTIRKFLWKVLGMKYYDLLKYKSHINLKDASWVEDFYKEVGLLRESRRTPERIAEGIEDLWEDSKFSQPLNEVIEE